MRFGGHETFPIREGWLHKGLKLLIEQPERLVDEYAADWLGVGRNMAKSIRYWLVATDLAEQSWWGNPKSVRLKETELGQLVHRFDPYFLEIGTWWALHVNLVNKPSHAASWTWFFNSFSLNRFERSVCVEGLRRHLQFSSSRPPSLKTLQRDIGCLLNSYAKKIPAEDGDPEEAFDCPFTELGLLTYSRASGFYQLHQSPKDIPPQLFAYALSRGLPVEQNGNGKFIDIPIRDAARAPGGPGRAFVFTADSLFEVALSAEGKKSSADIQITGLAGERVIRVKRKRHLDWLEEYYLNNLSRD